MSIKVACVQNTATRDIQQNIDLVSEQILQARSQGADFIALPETVGLIEPVNENIPEQCFSEEEDPGLTQFKAIASELNVTLLVGSQLIKEQNQIFNRSFLINTEGQITARYNKLHMFDIELSNGEFYRESDAITAGDTAVLAKSPWCLIGMSVCYDLRFPALYGELARQGAKILTIPAAFTKTTGKAHWHTLVRARAIETGSFVIAPNQCGHHVDKRHSWGHSLIVDPWGEILADGGDEVGIIMAEIDLIKVDKARSMIPVLTSGRDFTVDFQ
jgi:predicted amidohydrolase